MNAFHHLENKNTDGVSSTPSPLWESSWQQGLYIGIQEPKSNHSAAVEGYLGE